MKRNGVLKNVLETGVTLVGGSLIVGATLVSVAASAIVALPFYLALKGTQDRVYISSERSEYRS